MEDISEKSKLVPWQHYTAFIWRFSNLDDHSVLYTTRTQAHSHFHKTLLILNSIPANFSFIQTRTYNVFIRVYLDQGHTDMWIWYVKNWTTNHSVDKWPHCLLSQTQEVEQLRAECAPSVSDWILSHKTQCKGVVEALIWSLTLKYVSYCLAVPAGLE